MVRYDIYKIQMKVLVIFALVALAYAIDPPVLPPQFTLKFNQTAKIITTGKTNGVIYYDQPGNRQTVQRDDGIHDRYCGSVYKTSDIPCRHIIVDNKRYLDFPTKNYCCFCCDSSHGCGILARDWLSKAGAVYNGTEQLDAQGPYQKWEVKGGQQNFYWHKADQVNTPRKLLQVPEDDMDFQSFTVGKPDDSKFAVPSYCTAKCGLTTICAFLRGQTTK